MPCRIHALMLPALFTVLAASAGHAQEAQARLWNAAVSGDTVALVQAIDAGAVVDSLDVRSNPNGRRALNWAAWNNRVPVIRILVAHGATVNGSNLTGFSPLHHAAESGSLEAALALLTAGADPQRLNNDGETPSAVARRRGFTALADSIDAAAKRR